jgi:(4S)-4-hydroxy-5-phosphonooxypentane-2,3-dione isomerase
MLTVHVHIHVVPGSIEAFKTATRENAAASNLEAGIERFELLQQADEPARFVLVEVYRTTQAAADHKDTAHYRKWRDAVADMMAEPRSSIKYESL